LLDQLQRKFNDFQKIVSISPPEDRTYHTLLSNDGDVLVHVFRAHEDRSVNQTIGVQELTL